jgi:hypothetical protein
MPATLTLSFQSHDNARFLNKQTNQQLYRNALAMVVFSVGIPMCVLDASRLLAVWRSLFCDS